MTSFGNQIQRMNSPHWMMASEPQWNTYAGMDHNHAELSGRVTRKVFRQTQNRNFSDHASPDVPLGFHQCSLVIRGLKTTENLCLQPRTSVNNERHHA